MKDSITFLNWQEVDAEDLNNFLVDNGRVFQRLSYLRSYGKPLHGLVAIKNGIIIGAFIYYIFRKHGIWGIHIPPYAHFFGPVIASEERTNVALLKSILNQVVRGNLVELKVSLDLEDILPFVELGGRCMAIQTHVVASTSNYSENSIHASKRRYLKKLLALLEKGLIKVKYGRECLDDILFLQRRTAEKSNFSAHEVSLQGIVNGLDDDEFFALAIYDNNNQPISGAFCPYDNEYAYHIINASVKHEDSLLNKSNILATFLAVQQAGLRGLKFDFEGSSIFGVAEFYRQMGGAPVILHRVQLSGNWKARLYYAAHSLVR